MCFDEFEKGRSSLVLTLKKISRVTSDRVLAFNDRKSGQLPLRRADRVCTFQRIFSCDAARPKLSAAATRANHDRYVNKVDRGTPAVSRQHIADKIEFYGEDCPA
jgi:hypothetical protein